MTEGGTYLRGSEFRVNVLAPSVAAVVQCVGGWVFDRVRMGWAVRVGIFEHYDDDRPLRILGANATDLESMLIGVQEDSAPSALALDLALCRRDDRIGKLLKSALAEKRQVMTWGEHRPTEVDYRLGPTEHALSGAARVFKAHALNAASVEPIVGGTEMMHEYSVRGVAPWRQSHPSH